MLLTWDSGFRQQRARIDRRRSRNRRDDHERPADPLRAAESESTGWHGVGRPDKDVACGHMRNFFDSIRGTRRRTVRSNSDIGCRSLAGWPWIAIARASVTGTPKKKRSLRKAGNRKRKGQGTGWRPALFYISSESALKRLRRHLPGLLVEVQHAAFAERLHRHGDQHLGPRAGLDIQRWLLARAHALRKFRT